MRFPVCVPACLLLAGCASANGFGAWDVPAAEWTPPALADEAVPAAAPAFRVPVEVARLDRAIPSFQQGWGQQKSGSQDAPPPPPQSTGQVPASSKPASGKDFSRKGVYLSVGVLSSNGEFDFERSDEFTQLPIVPNVDETTSVEGEGLSLRLGFRTAENFALEVLMDFASYDMTEDIPGVNFDGTIDTFSLGVNGKVLIPIDRVEPYGLFGFGIGSASIDADYDDGVTFVSTTGSMTTFNFKLGLGVDIYAHRNFAVFLEWAANMGFGFESSGHSYVGVTNDIVFGAMFRF